MDLDRMNDSTALSYIQMIKNVAFQAHPGALNNMYGSLTQLQAAHMYQTTRKYILRGPTSSTQYAETVY